jgi:hypothetical protein
MSGGEEHDKPAKPPFDLRRAAQKLSALVLASDDKALKRFRKQRLSADSCATDEDLEVLRALLHRLVTQLEQGDADGWETVRVMWELLGGAGHDDEEDDEEGAAPPVDDELSWPDEPARLDDQSQEPDVSSAPPPLAPEACRTSSPWTSWGNTDYRAERVVRNDGEATPPPPRPSHRSAPPPSRPEAVPPSQRSPAWDLPDAEPPADDLHPPEDPPVDEPPFVPLSLQTQPLADGGLPFGPPRASPPVPAVTPASSAPRDSGTMAIPFPPDPNLPVDAEGLAGSPRGAEPLPFRKPPDAHHVAEAAEEEDEIQRRRLSYNSMAHGLAMSVEEYAAMRAELDVFAERANVIYERYEVVGAVDRRALDKLYAQRLSQEPTLRSLFEQHRVRFASLFRTQRG